MANRTARTTFRLVKRSSKWQTRRVLTSRRLSASPGQGLSIGESTFLLQLRQQQDVFRTNISVANTGSAPAEVEVRLYDGSGTELTAYTLDLEPYELKQDTEPFQNRANSPNLGWGYAKVTVVTGFGVLTSASVVDSVTNDATTVPMAQ